MIEMKEWERKREKILTKQKKYIHKAFKDSEEIEQKKKQERVRKRIQVALNEYIPTTMDQRKTRQKMKSGVVEREREREKNLLMDLSMLFYW
jgi:hypothetical protein